MRLTFQPSLRYNAVDSRTGRAFKLNVSYFTDGNRKEPYHQTMNNHNGSKPVLLQVYVGAHCWQCREARDLAAVMTHEFPTLQVRVIDLDQPGGERPAAVFAVPTFMLNGKIVSLGTPFRQDLARDIRQAFDAKAEVFGESRKNRLSTEE